MPTPPSLFQRICFLVAFLLFAVAAIQSAAANIPVTPWLIPGGLAAVALGLFLPW
jgi:hypothetical protein